MKKFSLLAMSVILAASMAVPAAAAENWEKAYSDIIYQRSLEDNFKKWQGSIFEYKYAVYDIDGNGTPELFCGERDDLYIYTMKNGKAKKIGNIGSLFMYIKPDENAVIDAPFTFAVGTDSFNTKYVMSNGEFKSNPETLSVKYKQEAWSAHSQEEAEKYATYYINGKVVSKSAYSAKAKTFYGNRASLDFYEMTKSGFRVNDLKSKITKRIVNKQATASSQKITVNGKNVTAESYLIDGNNYCKLRDIAYILRGTDSCFSVGWDSREQMIVITTGQDYTGKGGKTASGKKTATSTAADIYIDGDYVQLEGYNIGGSNYFKLRDIAEFVDAEVTWNNATKSVNIRTKNAPQYDSIEDMMEGYDKFLRSYSGENVAVATTEYNSLDTAAYHKWGSNPPSKASIKQGKVSIEPEVFALRDITGDGMPELFVGGKYDQYTVYEGDCNSFLVYTWKNGKMMPLFGNSFMDNLNPSLYLADGKYLVTYGHGTSGYQSWEYVSAVNGEVKVQFYDRTERPDGSGEYEYFSNGSKITKKEFDMHDAYESKAFSFEKVRFVDNTSSNRAAYLK